MLGCEPRWVFSAWGDAWIQRRSNGEVEEGASGAIERLELLLDRSRVAAPEPSDLPFLGGAVGWLAYDLGRQFESIDRNAARPRPRFDHEPGPGRETPDIRLGWYDAAAIYDHLTGAAWLVGIEGDRSAKAAIEVLALALGAELSGRPSGGAEVRGTGVITAPPAAPPFTPAQSNLTRVGYMERVEAVRAAIGRGEFYQLNLVQQFTCALRDTPAETYLRLRAANPAPYAAYLADEEGAVLCSSPERFLEVTPDGVIRTCPIKGTRPRGGTPGEDDRLRRELLASSKERAELLMIVDLLRNDLGRVCVPGSIHVRRLHALESFATVHHLVGEVAGQLREDISRGQLLRAVFPGGSITGAPKVSAMRAIEQLEPDRRGVAMGAIGYFSAHGRIDLAIAIRTITARAGVARVAVGAGIVWDSDPAAEYEETLAKARASFAALGAVPA